MEDEELIKQLKNLWIKANKPAITPKKNKVQKAIRAFWQHMSNNIVHVDLTQLRDVDMPIIQEKSKTYKDWHDFGMLLSPSGIVYMEASDLFKNMCKKISGNAKSKPTLTFALQTNTFELKMRNELLDQRICREGAEICKNLTMENLAKIRLGFQRYWIVLTSMGNIETFPFIEEIYNISREYKFPIDWQVIKYAPAEFRPDDENIPMLSIPTPPGPLGEARTFFPSALKYDIEAGKLLITVNDHVSMQELHGMREFCLSQLNSWFGEYAVAKNIKSFNILPELFVLSRTPDAKDHLKPTLGFYQQMEESMFAETKLCLFCQLRSCNTDFVNIDHSKFNMGTEDFLPEGNYCTYCIDCVDRLFMDKP